MKTYPEDEENPGWEEEEEDEEEEAALDEELAKAEPEPGKEEQELDWAISQEDDDWE